jgi:hypothetical protein
LSKNDQCPNIAAGLPAGEPFQARAPLLLFHRKSFERLQLNLSRECIIGPTTSPVNEPEEYFFTALSHSIVVDAGSTTEGDETDGDEGDRTPDPLLAKQVLSQLSYIPGGTI